MYLVISQKKMYQRVGEFVFTILALTQVLRLRFFAALTFTLITTASWASCPYGSGYTDGCSAAPAANADTIQQPGFFSSYAPQNGQAYVTRPPWNVAGVDYPVGIQSDYAGQLKDPSTAALPAGCAFYGGAAPYVNCANVHNLNISGYDFGHTAVGSVQLDIAGGVTGTLTISNDKFFNGKNVDSQYFGVIIYETNSANVVMKYNYLDGNGVNIPTGNLATMVADQSTGSLTFQYNAILNVPSKALAYSTGNSNVNISYNYGEGLNFGSAAHSEFTIGTTQGSEEIGFNTFLVNNNNGGATANIYVDNGTPGGTVFDANIDHNVDVSNYNRTIGSNTSSFLIEPGGQTFDNIDFTDNYFDPNGSYGCIYPFFTAGTQTYTGNVDLVSGSTLGYGGSSCDYTNGLTNGVASVQPVQPVQPVQSPIQPIQSPIRFSAVAADPLSGVPEPPSSAMMLIGCVVFGYAAARRGVRRTATASGDRP